jgi:spermidine synthase
MAAVSEVAQASKENDTRVAPASLGWLYGLFFLSGISGLMYQVVWLRMLTRILGSTTYATSTVLAAFMAGLALGSLLAGRFVDRVRWPLRWYALVELGIGLAALATLALPRRLLPVYQVIYDFAGGERAWLTAGQVFLTLVVLLVPTALMGATLPTLCAYGARRQLGFGRAVGFLYSLNTLGALVGVLSSGFVLLGVYGETITLGCGVLLNLLVAVGAWLGSWKTSATSAAPTATAPTDQASIYPASCRRAILFTFTLSGFVALGSEVIWSRMLLAYQGTSIYAFSSMLAVVLGGIGIGSLVGGSYVLRLRDPLRQLARLQLGIALATVVALHLFRYLPYGMLLPPLILLSPLGILWGISFPLTAACYASAQKGAGRSIGDLYAWNTVGCIVGSLGAGFVLLPLVGCSRAAASLAAVSLVPGVLLVWVHPQRVGRWRGSEIVLAGMCVLLLVFVGDPHFDVLKREMLDYYPSGIDIVSHTDEASATTTVFGRTGGNSMEKQLWVNGAGVTHLTPVTKLMAHLPMALADDPQDVLVLCMGMGTSLRSAAAHPGVRIRVVELVPAVTRAFAYFHPDAPHILQQPNVELVVDDGRNDLLMHPQKLYDVITLDPPPPLYSAGTVNLYSRDFLALCRDRLRPQGVLCVYIQPDSLSENRMLFRTFLDVFEHVRVWTGPEEHRGYLMIGTLRPLAMRTVPARIRKLYEIPAVADDLREWGHGLDRPEKILDLYVSDGDNLRAACENAPMVTDDQPFTEFPLWRMMQAGGEYHTMINAIPYKHQSVVIDPYR